MTVLLTIKPGVLIYAFRYTLGRRSYAPSDVQAAILGNLHLIPVNDQLLYVREVEKALETDTAGAQVDRAGWSTFAHKVLENLDTLRLPEEDRARLWREANGVSGG